MSFTYPKQWMGGSWDTYDTLGIPLNSVYFIDDSTGFVSGLYNLIMKTNGNIRGLPADYPWHLVIFYNIDDDQDPEKAFIKI